MTELYIRWLAITSAVEKVWEHPVRTTWAPPVVREYGDLCRLCAAAIIDGSITEGQLNSLQTLAVAVVDYELERKTNDRTRRQAP